MSSIRVGVVGAGYFGQFHAAKYAAMPGVELVAVADIDPSRARAVGREFAVPALGSGRDMFESVDAVSVATPAATHYAIARAFLERDIHVLVEKPIAMLTDEANDLVRLAEKKGVILQVGHQERFYFSRFDLPSLVSEPTEITCRRAGPYTGRGTDCSVVLDMMIHDLDLLHQITAVALQWVSGYGERVRSDFDDLADVTLSAGDDCVVRMFASRVHNRRERRLRICSDEGTLEIDFINQRFVHAPARAEHGSIGVKAEADGSFAHDWLADELSAFIASIRTGRPPLVGGADGRRALETALLIDRNLRAYPTAREA